ncbi:MAG: sodium:proton antiporter [Lachnospiraceae bacterium]|nr:sodium:proton antiporter [Lachnospiraceae bacterium]
MPEILKIFLQITLFLLAAGIVFGLVRAIAGPRRADRILGINMTGSLGTAAIAVSAVLFSEPWLLDVCLVYCLISFLAVVVLAKVHIEQKQEDAAHD